MTLCEIDILLAIKIDWFICVPANIVQERQKCKVWKTFHLKPVTISNASNSISSDQQAKCLVKVIGSRGITQVISILRQGPTQSQIESNRNGLQIDIFINTPPMLSLIKMPDSFIKKEVSLGCLFLLSFRHWKHPPYPSQRQVLIQSNDLPLSHSGLFYIFLKGPQFWRGSISNLCRSLQTLSNSKYMYVIL